MTSGRMVVLAGLIAMGSIAGLRSQTVPSTTASPTGLLLGRVVEAGSTRPISGVVVTMADPAAGPGSPARPRQVLTNAQGRFVFRQVPKGSYTLTATIGSNGFTPNGFIVTGQGFQIGAYLNGGFGQRRPGGPLQTLEIADGERLGDVVIGLWKGASISGTVRDEAGEALVGAVVGAVRVSSDGRLLTGPTKKTDDRGMYHIGTLVPGTYLVFVPQTQALVPDERVETALARNLTVPSGLTVGRSILSVMPDMLTANSLAPASSSAGTFVYRTTYHPSTDAAARATRVTLGSGDDVANVDVSLRPVRTVAVSGKLLRGGEPAAPITVHLMPAETKDGSSVVEVASTSTDGSGAFAFPLVPAGQYSIVALRNASSGNPGGPPGSAAPPVAGEWASQPIVVGDLDVTDVTVSMRPGPRLSGHVEFIGGSDRLPAARLQQLAITATISQAKFRNASASPGPSRLDADGRFDFNGVVPGRYRFRAAVPAPWVLQSVIVDGRDVTDTPLTIEASAIPDVTIIFADTPTAVAGDVRGGDGKADAQATVFLFPADRARWPDAGGSTRAFQSVRASTSGSFKISNAVAGDYLIAALREDVTMDWPDAAFLERIATVARPLRVVPGQTASISLTTAKQP